MTIPKLGSLERVPLRDVWESESSDFTPWLARPENIALLGETLQLDLEVEGEEQPVGPFRADILCKETTTDRWVVIENQLNGTDHDHLGKLLTYAAGLQATTVVWVAQRFTDEHRAALDWLNRITNEDVHFFGLEVEAWKIGDSLPAPKFNVVCQPNDWANIVAATAKQAEAGTLSPLNQAYLAFWQAFFDSLKSNQSVLRPVKPRAKNGLWFALGKSEFRLHASISNGRLTASLVCRDARLWPSLLALKEDIESTFGEPLKWDFSPTRNRNYVSVLSSSISLDAPASWPAIIADLQGNLERLQRAVIGRIKDL